MPCRATQGSSRWVRGRRRERIARAKAFRRGIHGKDGVRQGMRGKQIDGWRASIISAGCELQEGP